MTAQIDLNGCPTLSERLAEWTGGLSFQDVPDRAVSVAKLMVLDQLGLQLLGATMPNVQPELRLVQLMQAAPQSTIALHGTRTTAPYAAFVNGAFATSCEFDDCHMCAWHIGSFIVPAAMAVGESINASGRQVIEAIIAGAQVMAVLGCSIRDTMIRQGWHGAKILGTFGAVAAAGKLLGLTSIQMANAFGIAGSDAGGTMEYDVSGGEVKRMHAGSSGRLGTQAALLAQLGLTGPLTIFEGSRGLFRMFGQTDDLSSVDREWSKFHIVDTIFRPYPVIGSACAPLDAVRALQHQHDFDWRDVTRIDLGLLPFALGHGASIVEPTDAVSASFSTAFSLALRLVRRSNQPLDYMDQANWSDPDLLSVARKVVPYPTEYPEGAPVLSCKLSIHLKDGRVLSHFQNGFRGHPQSPATKDADISTKFRENVEEIVGWERASLIVAAVERMESVGEIGALASLLAAPTTNATGSRTSPDRRPINREELEQRYGDAGH